MTRSASVLLAALLVSCAPLTVTLLRAEPPAQAESVQLPDTPAGRVARAFLAMINDPSPHAVERFETAHAGKKRLAAVPMPDRVTRMQDMHQRWAALTPVRVVSSSDAAISIDMRSAAGDPINMEFQLDAAEAGKLESILITSGGPGVAPKPVTPEMCADAANAACRALADSYVYPEVAKKMADAVRAKVAAGEYDAITDDAALARRLTDDLQAVSKDKHLRVRLAPAESQAAPAEHEPPRDEMRRENYGFRKAEILPGNIGYLRFDVFVGEDEEAKATASAAMNFLAHCNAIIFDMRYNGGGSPDMIRYITSYLFDKPTHLNDMIDRTGKTVEEWWTLESVPGERPAADTPVYVLTSSRTFSGAEEFSYNLRNLDRATLVGETTGGGAHPVQSARLTDRLIMTVPFMRANNPISKTNWEGTGVAPHIAVPADQALDRAQAEARKAVASRSTGKP